MIVHGLWAVYVMHHMRIAIKITFNGNTERPKNSYIQKLTHKTF